MASQIDFDPSVDYYKALGVSDKANLGSRSVACDCSREIGGPLRWNSRSLSEQFTTQSMSFSTTRFCRAGCHQGVLATARR